MRINGGILKAIILQRAFCKTKLYHLTEESAVSKGMNGAKQTHKQRLFSTFAVSCTATVGGALPPFGLSVFDLSTVSSPCWSTC